MYNVAISFRFTQMCRKLPPKGADVLFQKSDGSLWAGQFDGYAKVYDHQTNTWTGERGYSVAIFALKGTRSYHGGIPRDELVAWAPIP